MISGSSDNDRRQRAAADEEEQAAAAAARANQHHAVAASRQQQWSAQTESRIVRVSRVFGGKDRHSKVKTVKGLRDRRVRLSVPTAIQLYDLQDRLGLNQPSKVVDWLLNAARHEIDKLPPLQFPPHAQDLHHHHHLPSAMPLMHVDDKQFGGHHHIAALATGEGANYHRFMGLNNSLGMASTAMAAYNAYTAGEGAWNNSSSVHDDSGGAAASPHVAAAAAAAAAHHSSFPSLLSLAPGPHQLVFYSSEAADQQQFQVGNNLGSQGLSLSSSARAFHDQAGS